MSTPAIQKTTVVVNNWTKGLKAGNYRVPKGTVSYDAIKGYSLKKGQFEIYQFKNALGKVIKSCHKYIQGAKERLKIRNFKYINKSVIEIRETSYEGKDETGFKGTIFAKAAQNSKHENYTRVIEEEKRKDGFIHSWKYLSPGKKPEGIKYRYLGYSPYSSYTLIGSKDLGRIENNDLIPAIISLMCSSHNIDAALETLQHFEERQLKIKGFVDPIKRVSLKELNPNTEFSQLEKGSKEGPDNNPDSPILAWGEYKGFTGQISIFKNVKDLLYLSRIVAHESKHLQDAIMMTCLEDFSPSDIYPYVNCTAKQLVKFANQARQKFGIIKKTDPKYKEYKEVYEAIKTYATDVEQPDGWEESPVERNPIEYEKTAVTRVKELFLNMDKNFMN